MKNYSVSIYTFMQNAMVIMLKCAKKSLNTDLKTGKTIIMRHNGEIKQHENLPNIIPYCSRVSQK